jgi:ClpX C4-type zinc finger
MSEESNKQCSICFRRYTEFGHPAEPVRSGRCCNACNDLVVIPARLRAAREATVAPPALTAVSEDHKVVCSFCGKSNLQTKLMVAAPADSNSNAVICNECIARCVDIVREQDERKAAEAGREMTVSGKAPRGRKAKKAGHVPGVGDVKE